MAGFRTRTAVSRFQHSKFSFPLIKRSGAKGQPPVNLGEKNPTETKGNWSNPFLLKIRARWHKCHPNCWASQYCLCYAHRSNAVWRQWEYPTARASGLCQKDVLLSAFLELKENSVSCRVECFILLPHKLEEVTDVSSGPVILDISMIYISLQAWWVELDATDELKITCICSYTDFNIYWPM